MTTPQADNIREGDSVRTVDWDGLVTWHNAAGQMHRLNGPAYDWPGAGRMWFVAGKRHRLDGPAIEWADGSKAWYLHDKQLSKEEFDSHPEVIAYQKTARVDDLLHGHEGRVTPKIKFNFPKGPR